MGLDIFFESKKREEEVCYFRKHNHLIPYFGYGEDFSVLNVEKSQIEDYVSDCKAVLEHWGKPDFEEVAEEKIPTCEGFFFGCYEYDEYYKEKLEEDLKAFQKVLETFNWDEDELIMHCWW